MSGGRLTARVVATGELGVVQVDAMWSVFEAHYADVERTRFEADLQAKERVILLLDGEQIVGFSTYTHLRGEVEGRRYLVAFSGDTVVASAYWGQTALQRAFAWQAFLTWLSNPFGHTYWFLISKGYKTYLLLTRNWIHAWPVHGRPVPPFEAGVMADAATRMFGDAFKRERGVVVFARPMGRLREGVAEPVVDDPDVRYFVRRNPGHAQGEELVCLGRLEIRLFLWFVVRHLFPWLRRRKR